MTSDDSRPIDLKPETLDEELLRGVGPYVPESAADDPERLKEIHEEFAMGFAALADLQGAVSVFGSSRTQPDHPDYALAKETAKQLGAAGFSIITGGGPGIMEAANRGAQEAGAKSIGLNINLAHEQQPNQFQDLSLTFKHFFTRKVMFIRYSHAFIAMPGGFGTLDELTEALNLVQTSTIRNFPSILVGSEFWGGLVEWLEAQLVEEGKIDRSDMRLLQICDKPEEVVAAVEQARAEQRLLDGKNRGS